MAQVIAQHPAPYSIVKVNIHSMWLTETVKYFLGPRRKQAIMKALIHICHGLHTGSLCLLYLVKLVSTNEG